LLIGISGEYKQGADRVLALLLASEAPDAVVILRGAHAFSAEAVRDYAELVRDLEQAHPVTQRFGPFEVRRRGTP
jgi:hypothetical protein